MRAVRKRETGATLVETAFVLSLIAIPVLIGIVEFGLYFKDWLSASHASTEATAAVTALANDPIADIVALEAIEDAFVAVDLGDLGPVVISNLSGPGTNTYTYVAASPCKWTPCPDPDIPALYVPPAWPPSSRNVTVGAVDTIEVSVSINHSWVTGFFGNQVTITAAAEGQLEPQRYNS